MSRNTYCSSGGLPGWNVCVFSNRLLCVVEKALWSQAGFHPLQHQAELSDPGWVTYFFKSQVYNCKKGIITLHRVVAHIKWGSPKKSLVHNLYFFPPPSSSPRIFWITSV
jgi:hypothetical protein